MMNLYENLCQRCGRTVYQVDRIGPLKDFTFYHTHCFKCAECGSKLTLRTYCNNQNDQEDKEVYCSSHQPKIGPGTVDGEAVLIRSALNVPKTYEAPRVRGAGEGGERATGSPYRGGSHSSSDNGVGPPPDYKYGRFDSTALHIAHALNATKIQKSYLRVTDKPIDSYLDVSIQKQMEMKHRLEEDDLYQTFMQQRQAEDLRLQSVLGEEWQQELERITSRFERDLAIKKRNKEEAKLLTVKHNREKDELEKNMTIKRNKTKEGLTRKMLEHERAATAALVERHSREMMRLVQQKRLEALDSEDRDAYPAQPPPPLPPPQQKTDIYLSPEEFAEVDQLAIQVAQEDQKTFTDLVRQLVGQCTSDVEKARTIFRWITVKNLNSMSFEDTTPGDTPMALLRGIKYGTESYHVLFKRLCSYAGLHCVVIKGFSKSAGYQPGVAFEDSRFRNSWNAVYVAGAWRFVQCNWGARHLVNARETPKKGGRGKSDSLRYEYDDHYFLTDPKEFIYEFYPLQSDWQLLRTPISQQEFETLPFVRSLFFRYGLFFPDDETQAVMYTDSTGAATIRLGMPTHLLSSLIFHYNLKLYDSDKDQYDGVNLKRFVMQSVMGDTVAFRVHAPCSGALLLDIFANAVTPREYLTGEPMKFKSVCKFKIVCADLRTVMVPLPDCASGEWGPVKAVRLFGLEPLTHSDALVFAGPEVEIKFRMSRPLTDFMATLHRNGFEEKRLNKYVSHRVSDGVVTFTLTFPEDGQFGMDVYTREVAGGQGGDAPNEKNLLTHCCKYLINSTRDN